MTHVDQPRLDPRQTLDSLYATIAPELARVERRLQGELRSDHPQVDAVIRHGIQLSGKRLRPGLLLLSGRSVGRLREAHVVLATVVEMIHTATLVHDDVLDEAVLRRHTQTVNARWNNETSVLLGDFLFTHAFCLASTLENTYACRTIGRATNIVCDGELRQTLASGNMDLSEDDYLAIVEAKTAELCACACELGAHYAGGDDEAAIRLSAFGRNLGIAFQIADDLLDLEGSEAIAGKSLGTDLAKRKMTLPLIHARDSLDEPERSAFLALLADLPLPLGEGRGEDLPLPSGEGRGEGASPRRAEHPLLPADLLKFARELRREQTEAESLMWALLRSRRLGGFKFRRQHPLDPYILDFYCDEQRLAIGLDGGQHNSEPARSEDEKRIRFLAKQGIRVLRFWNHDVLQDTDTVLEAIWRELHASRDTLTPNPSPQGRGEPILPLPWGEGRGEGARDALMDWLTRHDSFAYARAQAQFYARQAQAELAALADSPAKFALAALADFAVARSG